MNRRLLAAFLFAAIHVAAQTPVSPRVAVDGPVSAFSFSPRLAIVFMGDSYASGEGAPNPGATRWNSDPCHRSERNGRHAAAIALKEAAGSQVLQFNGISHTVPNFDFTDVSCSGATVNAGILGPYNGVTPLSPTGPGPVRADLPSQIEQARAWMVSKGRSRLDVVVLSIGGNDVGFGDIVATCMNPLVQDCSSDAALHDIMENGRTGNNPSVVGFRRLAGAFEAMDAEIRRVLNPARIILIGYPNPVRDRFDNHCDGFDEGFSIFPEANGTVTPHQNNLYGSTAHLSAVESRWIEGSVVQRLNAARRSSSDALGWTFLDIQNLTRTRGFCNPANRSFFNTPRRSFDIQGDFNGTAHPNAAGYRIYEHIVLQRLARDLDIRVNRAPTGLHEEFGYFLTPRLAPSQRIFFDGSNWADIVARGPAYVIPYEKDFLMQFQFLLNPTPNAITDVRLEVSPIDFRFNPPPALIQSVTPVNNAARSGLIQARLSSAAFPDNSVIFVRWSFRHRVFWDTAAPLATAFSSTRAFRVKGIAGPLTLEPLL